MTNIKFLWSNIYDLDATVKTAATEATGFPLTNIVNRWHTRRWRSTADTAQWIKMDLGSAITIKALVIKNHNFTNAATLKIQANATDAWGAPTLDAVLAWTTDRIVKLWTAGETYRWWRITMEDGANPDTYLAIGRIFLGSYFEPTNNFIIGNIKKLVDPSIKLGSSGGQYSVDQKEHYRAWSYDFRSIEDPDQDTFEDIFDHVGQSKPYFIVEDADDTWETTYYVQNLTDWEIEEKIASEVFALKVDVEEMR